MGQLRTRATVWCSLAAFAPAQQPAWDIPHRGAHVFERTTEQFEVAPPATKLKPLPLVRGGRSSEPQRWRYFATPRHGVPPGFELPGFADAAWPLGEGGFGTDVGDNPNQRTRWASEVLCLRAAVDLGAQKPKALWFDIDHDDGVRVWLNGKLIVADDGYGTGRTYVVTGGALDAWQRGQNLLAVQCTNTGGAQYLDLSLAGLAALPPGARKGDGVQEALRGEREAADRVRRELFPGRRPPPMLLQGELDPSGRTVRIPPADLRELGWWIATDLACGPAGGNVQADATRMLRLGDLRLRGRASAADGEGWQTIEVTVKNTKEPAPGHEGTRFVDRFVKPHVSYGFDGTLTVRRQLATGDAGARVVAFETQLAGTVLSGKDWKEPAAELRQRERWRLVRTHRNQDAEFRALVQRAIEKGSARLREQLKNVGKGAVGPDDPDGDRSYNSGRLAIGLLALLKAELPHDDEVVQKGLAELRRRRLVDTYSLANAIMAIEALYAPATEIGRLRDGTLDRPLPRTPSEADRALLQEWVTQLLGNIDTGVDPAYLLRFNYVPERRYDHSVNQYGLLGLYSAHLCGIGISPQVWEAAANHLIDAQAEEGPKVALELVDYRSYARQQADPSATFTASRIWAKANGWSYYGPKDNGENSPVWGSMTCAGITGLVICQAALADHPQVKRSKLQSDADRARRDGFAWLAEYMTVRHHAGAIQRQHTWFYYYLYSLERAALLAGIALIQDRDWYFEGAMALVLTQNDDGNWPGDFDSGQGIEINAMAVLFLKQSTRPVLTGR